MTLMQRAVSLIYPDQCAVCPNYVDGQSGLCAECWKKTHFATGLTCDQCARPLPGALDQGSELCDECLSAPRLWAHGRASLYYTGIGRRIVLSLKYGDRTDLAEVAARWMKRSGQDVLLPETLLVPIPSHWRRLLKRRYNAAVELANALQRDTGCRVVPDALKRTRATRPQEGLGFVQRHENVDGAFVLNEKRRETLAGHPVVLVDDTFTSGATLAAASRALLQSDITSVSVLVLARTLGSD